MLKLTRKWREKLSHLKSDFFFQLHHIECTLEKWNGIFVLVHEDSLRFKHSLISKHTFTLPTNIKFFAPRFNATETYNNELHQCAFAVVNNKLTLEILCISACSALAWQFIVLFAFHFRINFNGFFIYHTTMQITFGCTNLCTIQNVKKKRYSTACFA